MLLKGLALFALGVFILICAYRHRYTKPESNEKCCKQCGMPDWAREERCWYRDCPCARTK